MRKIKTFLCIALFGAMSIGAYSAYDYITMSADDKAILENIEALTNGETSGSHVPGYEVVDKAFTQPSGEVVTIPCCAKTEPHMLCASYIYATCVTGKP